MDNQLAKKFGEVLREQRLAIDLSQEELAHRCDLDRTYISLLERGRRQPSLTTLFEISEQLGMSPSKMVKKLE